MKRSSVSLLLFSTVFSAYANPFTTLDELDLSKSTILIPRERVQLCNMDDEARLFYNGHGFFVNDGDATSYVKPYDTDPIFEGKCVNDIMECVLRNKLRVVKIGERDYQVDLDRGLRGGGPTGFMIGAYAGKFITHLVGHTVILVVSAGTGPLAPATFTALEATFGPTIEAASVVTALAGGIAGGVATGPA